MFKTNIYVKVFENRVSAKNVDSGILVERKSKEPFSHERALVGSFTEAGITIKAAVNEVKGSNFLNVVRILIQPMEKNEGGLTEIESRVFRELALSAGGAKVVVWEGEALSDAAVIEKL